MISPGTDSLIGSTEKRVKRWMLPFIIGAIVIVTARLMPSPALLGVVMRQKFLRMEGSDK